MNIFLGSVFFLLVGYLLGSFRKEKYENYQKHIVWTEKYLNKKEFRDYEKIQLLELQNKMLNDLITREINKDKQNEK